MMKLVIPGTLPGLNDYTRAQRADRHVGAKMKKSVEEVLALHIRQQFRGVKILGQVFIECHWYEPNRRRDLDNVAFAKKFIQDALVRCGAIEGDGWKHVIGFSDRFGVDPKNPRVEVVIEAWLE